MPVSWDQRTNTVYSVCVTLDGQWMISGSLDGIIRKCDIVTGECVNELKGHTDAVMSVSSHNNIVC
eukprot:CAMPEP_0194412796 /NCGR_PEP_ID=MMETSP0176-20130528/11249_1 /TAXON_ID=216777 /ORGANISM="Proboscia alata, Strain PI-D3" /LENGTH=65 /DNA_ID=CAMNT_0039215719 /DNA_START=12 /DNA_END=206 /DNA_ORIENTATION=-